VYFPNLRDTFPLVQGKNRKGEIVEKCQFYKHIRCGILHQAETTGGYSVVRDGPLFDPGKGSVNANKFLKALNSCLDKYLTELQANHVTSERWKAAVKKAKCICDNFEHGG